MLYSDHLVYIVSRSWYWYVCWYV